MVQGSSFTFTTITFSMLGAFLSASSAMSLSFMCLPERRETLEVTSSLHWEVVHLPLSESAENPAENNGMNSAILAQASMATGSSGTMGM